VARGQHCVTALWVDSERSTLARRMHQGSATTVAIDYISPGSILTATILGSERRSSAPLPVNPCAFRQRIQMSDANAQSVESRIAGVVQRLLAEHSIDRAVAPDEDLRLAGLSSLDMVSLVLSIEEEFDFMVPESSIMPSNFRSISTIGQLVTSLQKNG
jgi:acyl carrier protein